MNRIPERIKAYRALYHLSQRQLASMAGISPATLSRIEQGEDCKLSAIIKIEKALGRQLY